MHIVSFFFNPKIDRATADVVLEANVNAPLVNVALLNHHQSNKLNLYMK